MNNQLNNQNLAEEIANIIVSYDPLDEEQIRHDIENYFNALSQEKIPEMEFIEECVDFWIVNKYDPNSHYLYQQCIREIEDLIEERKIHE